MDKIAVYPGSFDPPTNGHIDLINRALTIFDRIIVAVIDNPSKRALFTLQEREGLLKEILSENNRIKVESFSGLLVDFVDEHKAIAILRGLRAVSDFEYEFQMALMNRRMKPQINSVYLMPSTEFSYLSSSLIREIFSLGGCIDGLVPDRVKSELGRKLNRNQLNGNVD